MAEYLRVESAVLDGEIACVDDDEGRPVFRDLLFRRRQSVFIAFDLLYVNGKDLRTLPMIERKAALKKLLRVSVLTFFISITRKVTDDCCLSKSSRWIWKKSSASGRIPRTK